MKIFPKCFFVFLPFIIAGCNAVSQQATDPAMRTQVSSKRPPVWIDKSFDGSNEFVGVGSAQPNPLGDKSFQRQTAAANARDELAQRLNVRVQNMFRNLFQQDTTGSVSGKKQVKTDVAERVIEKVSRQLANVELSGSVIKETWTDPDDGTLWVMVSVSKESTDQALEQIARTQIKAAIKDGIHNLDEATEKLDAAIAETKNIPSDSTN